jgi:Tetratricopeptide repeat
MPYFSPILTKCSANLFIFFIILLGCYDTPKILPTQYREAGAYVKSLPYYNPDSCVLLIRRDVPPEWQGAAYENLFLGGPEDSPLELGFKHLDLYEKNFPADSAHAFTQLWRGRLYIHLLKLDSAEICLTASSKISQQHKWPLRISSAEEGLAALYYTQGKTAEALRAHLKIYEAIQHLDSTYDERKLVALTNVTADYSQSNNNHEALKWLQKRLPYFQNEHRAELRGLKITYLGNASTIYRRLNMPDSAILFAQQAFQLCEQYQTNNDKSELLTSLGLAYYSKGDCSRACSYYQRAFQSKKSNSPKALARLMTNMADAYMCLSQLDSAQLLYETVLPKSVGTVAAHIYGNLSTIYAQKGYFQRAYESQKKGQDLQKEMYNIEKVQEIGAIKSELELERTQNQVNILQKQTQINQQQLLILVLLLATAIGFALSYYFRQRGTRQLMEKERLAYEYRELLQQQSLQQAQNLLQQTKEELEYTHQMLLLKNQLLDELNLRIDTKNNHTLTAITLENADTMKDIKILNSQDWDIFRERCDTLFPGIITTLANHPYNLSSAEIRLFLLLKLKFDSSEISDVLGISRESVWRSRHRLAKKVGLYETADLDVFVDNFA